MKRQLLISMISLLVMSFSFSRVSFAAAPGESTAESALEAEALSAIDKESETAEDQTTDEEMVIGENMDNTPESDETENIDQQEIDEEGETTKVDSTENESDDNDSINPYYTKENSNSDSEEDSDPKDTSQSEPVSKKDNNMEKDVLNEEEFIYVNPLYEELISKDDLIDLPKRENPNKKARSSESLVNTIEQAGDILCEQMIARKDNVTITVDITGGDFYGLENSDIYQRIIQQALIENEDCRSGDYLRFQFSGFRIGVTTFENSIELRFIITYFTSAEQENQVDCVLSQVMETLNLQSEDELQTVLQIYNYITENVAYDSENLNDQNYKLKYSAFAALVDKKAVCQGYASLFYRMCRECGLSVRVISGAGIINGTSETHTWNIVRIGDYYYNVDTTWDTGRSLEDYQWFLKCDNSFEGHLRDADPKMDYTSAEFYSAYPMSDTDYEFPLETIEITIQPTDVSAGEGEQVILHLEAAGNDISYRWQWRTEEAPWKNCTSAGSDTDTFSFRMKESLSGRIYRCIVTGSDKSLVSDEAHIYLNNKPVEITIQPEDIAAAVGDPVVLHLEAVGSGITYQWQWTTDGKNWKNCTSAGYNTNTFRFVMKESLAGRIYRCIVSGNENAIISNQAHILLQESVEIQVQPNDVTAAVGEQVVLHLEATGDGINYQWQWSSDGKSWRNCASTGYNTDTFRFTMKASLAGRTYRCIVSGTGRTLISNNARIFLNAMAEILVQPEDVTAAVGEQAVLHLEATGTGISYQWQWSTDGKTWKNCTSAGYNTDTFRFTMKSSLAGRIYRCIVKSPSAVQIPSNSAHIFLKNSSSDLPEDLRAYEQLSSEYNSSGIHTVSFKYGSSVRGRDLIAWSVSPQSYDRTMLLNFEIHGWEDFYASDGQLLVDLGNAVVSHYSNDSNLNGCRLIIIPSCNPDGLLDGYTNNGFGRCNAEGIDLNRDFDVAYQTYSETRNYTPYAFSGKESAALRDLVYAVNPFIAIDFHGWENCTIGSSDVGEVFARYCGLNHKNEFSSSSHGYFAYWVQSLGARGLLVEFKNPESLDHDSVVNALDHLILGDFGTEITDHDDPFLSEFCPITTYAINSGRVYVQREAGGTGTDYGYIDGADDQCTVIQVYEDGWCKVHYPVSNYTKTGYCEFSQFYAEDYAVTPYTAAVASTTNVYTTSEMTVKFGSVWSTDEFTVIGEKENACQIIYPLDSGGFKMGWIDKQVIIK